VATFVRDGFVVVPGFYDVAAEIEPILRAIYDLIGLVAKRHAVPLRRVPYSPGHFDDGFLELLAADRSYGSEVYDAIKLIPALVRLAASAKNENAFRQLRGTDLPGFIARGYGIRIDIPGEDKFRALWHQEYLFQLRSRDGITLWSSLIPMIPNLGPVIFAPGSHRHGVHRVYEGDRRKPGVYAWTLEKESELVDQFPHVAPLSGPGDVILLDFQVLHCSGHNRGNRARWSMQMRMFNFLEESGIQTGWKGAVAEGVHVPEVFPQFFVPSPAGI
jgi:hypothetical protein